MNTLTSIEAENVDQGIYNFFTNAIDQYTDGTISYGQAITEILNTYIKFAKNNPKTIAEKIEEFNNRPYPTTTITINQIHPQTHKKFRKYLQKKYKTRNINPQHYNQELNAALILYVSIIQLPIIINEEAFKQAIERKDLDTEKHQNGYDLLKEEFTLLCQENKITPEQANIYGFF